MAKISQYLRDSIRRQLLERYEAPYKEVLRKQSHDVAWMAINIYLGFDKDKWQTCPPAWFEAATTIYWQSDKGTSTQGGRRPWHAQSREACLTDTVCLPVVLTRGGAKINDPLLELAWQRWDEAKKEHAKAVETLRDKINGALIAASTTAQLVKLWPEIDPFLPPSAQIINLPQPSLASLNKTLGLGPTEQKKEKA